MRRNEDSLRDLWNNIKHTNIHILGAPEGEEREKGPEKIFEEIIAENFPNMGKEIIVDQVQEAQSLPSRKNPRGDILRHIEIKLIKIKDRDQILKAIREKWQKTYKETPIRLQQISQQKLDKPKENGMIYFKWWKGRNYNQEYSTQQDSPSYLLEKSKAFQTSKS